MVKVTLVEDGNKTIKHECKCAFACLIKPAEAPEGNKAITCLLGSASIKDIARSIAKCALSVLDHMSNGDEVVKDAALYELLRGLDEEGEEDENPAKDTKVIPIQTKISRT